MTQASGTTAMTVSENTHQCEGCDYLIDLDLDEYEVLPDEGGPDAVNMFFCEFCILEAKDER